MDVQQVRPWALREKEIAALMTAVANLVRRNGVPFGFRVVLAKAHRRRDKLSGSKLRGSKLRMSERRSGKQPLSLEALLQP